MKLIQRCPLVSWCIVSIFVFYYWTIRTYNHHSQPLEWHDINTNNRSSAGNRDTFQSVGKNKKMNTTKNDTSNKTSKNNGHRLIFNQHQYEYVLYPHNVCDNETLFAIIYVHTAHSHYTKRMLIRQTWGNIFRIKIAKFRVVFVIGVVLHEKEAQRQLKIESEKYNDIVQFNFIDTYRNLSLKAIGALSWINAHCSNTMFVIKTDDDVFVNMFTLFRQLKSIAKINGNNTKGMIMCNIDPHAKSHRKGKWAVSKIEYKYDYYPPFCFGAAFIMTSDVAVQLFQVYHQVPFLWLDDVYLTGLVTAKAGNITMHQWKTKYLMDSKSFKQLFTGPKWMQYIFCHVDNNVLFQYVWDQICLLNLKKEKGTK